MKAIALSLSIALMVHGFAVPTLAQDDAGADTVDTCVRLTSEVSLAGLAPAELGQLLIDGDVQVVVLEPQICAPAEPPSPVRPKGTSYMRFVARGAGAAIELRALAEHHEGVDSLTKLDAAAVSVAAWAKQQRKWLDDHPPQACYRDVHKQWRKGVIQVRQGAKAVRRSIRTLEPAPMRKAVRQLWAGVGNLTDVDLDAAAEACAKAG